MRMICTLIAATVGGLALAACGDTSQTAVKTVITFAAEDGSAAEQFIADASNLQSASFKVTYETSLDGGDLGVQQQSVTWYKATDGRQRFDFSGNKNYYYYDNASVFTVGYKDRIVLCSNDLPVTPTDQEGSGPTGACCEGSSTCGDLAGNILYFLGFPLGFDESAPATDDDIANLEDEVEIEVSRRDLAGVEARCYKIRKREPEEYDDPQATSELCFTASGVQAYWRRTGEGSGNVEVEATTFATPGPEDFEFPYGVYESPNE